MLSARTKWVNHCLLLFAGVVLWSGTTMHTSGDKKRFQLEQGSRLYIKGTSNVNSFTCDCQDQYSGQIADIERKGGYAKFKNVELFLRTSNFDCHNRKIDHDIQKALKADQYPHIKIALLDTWQNARCLDGDCKDWFDVQANVNVTITHVSKVQSIPAKARILGPNRFQLRGENALQMSAFGIEPPEAMFGLIKVNDWITFYFDLIVQVEAVQ